MSAMLEGINSRLEGRLCEALDELWNQYVDPREAFSDDDGTTWLGLGVGGNAARAPSAPFATEAELGEIRRQCRVLALVNEFAINGHENRVSYIVGSGHTYRATLKKGRAAPPELVAAVQAWLDRFLQQNQWHRRQQELVLRRDRDGEAFVRLFIDAEGNARVRFVEPAQIATPPAWSSDPSASFGVLTERDDVETVRAYFVDGAVVDAAEIQHRKANVDMNVKRGLPLFFPVRKNLRRAEKLLRNMSVVAEIQSAIALIRRHQGTRSAVQQFAAADADGQTTSPTGRTTSYKRYAAGTILDAPLGVEYDFPASQLDAGNFVAVLQAELRAIASRLVMPEFMLSSDASNANYASTMVAEGPAVKMFERLQAQQVFDDLELLWRVVKAGVASGQLPAGVLDDVEIQALPPRLGVRNAREDADVAQIEHAAGILSVQTWSLRAGLDYDQEQTNFAQHGPTKNTGN